MEAESTKECFQDHLILFAFAILFAGMFFCMVHGNDLNGVIFNSVHNYKWKTRQQVIS